MAVLQPAATSIMETHASAWIRMGNWFLQGTEISSRKRAPDRPGPVRLLAQGVARYGVTRAVYPPWNHRRFPANQILTHAPEVPTSA